MAAIYTIMITGYTVFRSASALECDRCQKMPMIFRPTYLGSR